MIAIIAVLMALLFPHLASAKETARRQKAASILKNIINAAAGYKNEYGKYPPIEAAKAGDDQTNGFYSYGDIPEGKCQVDNNKLFDVLRAIPRNENSEHKLNYRQQKYFQENKATDPKNPREGFLDGSEFDSSKLGQLMDPWGTQYCIILESDGDEIIDMSEFYTDLAEPANHLRNSAVAFCMAKDGKRGGKGYEGKLRKEKSSEAPDDIVSWQ